MVHPKSAAAKSLEMGKVYCPICTHTVDAHIESRRNLAVVKPGQRCPRCAGSLDAGYIFQTEVLAARREA